MRGDKKVFRLTLISFLRMDSMPLVLGLDLQDVCRAELSCLLSHDHKLCIYFGIRKMTCSGAMETAMGVTLLPIIPHLLNDDSRVALAVPRSTIEIRRSLIL